MTIDINNRFSKTEKFVETDVDGEVVLMDIEDGKFFSLEQTGRRVWELLDEHDSIKKLSDKLTSEYDIDAASCQADLGELISDFLARGMVHERVG